jgi:metallo-beta-lactamase family protein
MALACLQVYRDARKNVWPELRPDLGDGDPFDPGHLVEVHTAEESAWWNDPRIPAIIISASGMASSGRVLHHLRHILPNHRHTVAIVGFAAEGTRARQLLDGQRRSRSTAGTCRCADVVSLEAFSAHADALDLVSWATAAPAPTTCRVVHGEQQASLALAARRHERAGWTAVVPKEGERVLL